MNIERIELEKMINTRDLGGIACADGRKIKPKKLIRSGQLADGTADDISVLQKMYNLQTVIDLRTEVEICNNPDPKIDGIDYFSFPVLDERIFGIARDEYSMQAWLNMFGNTDENPDDVFGSMYENILFGERVIPMVRGIFDILLEERQGSVLWHCSAGKDRVGIVTMLILAALGADRSTITADYLATQYFSRELLSELEASLPLRIKDERIRECIIVLYSVKKVYIDRIYDRIEREYGDVYSFLEKRFGVTLTDTEKLKNMYLQYAE